MYIFLIIIGAVGVLRKYLSDFSQRSWTTTKKDGTHKVHCKLTYRRLVDLYFKATKTINYVDCVVVTYSRCLYEELLLGK